MENTWNKLVKSMRISKATVFIAFFIIVSGSFMRQLMEFFIACFGKGAFLILVGIIFFAAAFLFSAYLIKTSPGVIKTMTALIVTAAGIFFTWQMLKIPQERVHLLEYGILGWFAGRDLGWKNEQKAKGIILAWMLTITAGVVDETFQKILPYRVGDSRDVLFNGLGGLWGIVLYGLQRH